MILTVDKWLVEKARECRVLAANKTGAERERLLIDAQFFDMLAGERARLRVASMVSLSLCDVHNGIHLNLLDDCERVFATGLLPAERWKPFRQDFDMLARESVRRPSEMPSTKQ